MNDYGLIEMTGVSFHADKPWILVKPNKKYIEAEIKWYESMSLDVRDLFKIYGKEVKIWKDVSGKNGFINSNYGHLVFSDWNSEQYTKVFNTLKNDQNSRRAVMIYTNPEMHREYERYGANDFVCTNVVQYFIHNDIMSVVVQMRSNDAVFGYGNDWAWQNHILKMLASDLKVKPGKITWQVGSLHVYPRHFKYLENL